MVDVGRYSEQTPWPLLLAADLVLIAVRPTQRHVLAARPVLAELAERIAPHRVALAVCATTPAGTREVCAAVEKPAAVTLPADPRAAAVFADGLDGGVCSRRSALLRRAHHAALHLHATHHRYTTTVEPASTTAAVSAGALLREA
ncbi:hypothetical protein [Prauserella marina]|uniref:hypothetical protein n=1 Tax=Prauserella marina TaxID=530584 RepID=UPI000ABEB1E0|nr:hypothetical protein [Prauserella marina]